ncbi:MAG: HAD-IC family P-type ATPase, partial [Clostridiales bacterium]|nr:HAD-IC family P-type ATPase [Clostridiales bacterium]
SHVFTFFNLLNLLLALALLLVGSYKNMLFLGVVLSNTFIGIFQELKAKKTVSSLQLLATPKVLAIRDQLPVWIDQQDIVVDDLLVFFQGDQLAVDGEMVGGQGALDEALLTGESDPVIKNIGNLLLSGSFVLEGTLYMQVTNVGSLSYAANITLQAKTIKSPKSELMTDLNKLIKIMSFLLFPIGILLFLKQVFWLHLPLAKAVPTTVGSMIGMIPEGLMLLASLALTVGVVRLGKKKVLAQDIYALESLARVDVLCVDKTGTLTEGKMTVAQTIPYECDQQVLHQSIGHLMKGLEDNNLTLQALRQSFLPAEKGEYQQVIPFSSKRKWSGVYERQAGSYVMGALSHVFPKGLPPSLEAQKNLSVSQGYRVLVVAHSLQTFIDSALPQNLTPLGLVLLQDKLRPDVKEAVAFFAREGVSLCILSGDDPKTVSFVAKELGISHYALDASTIQKEEHISQALQTSRVFGRVSPDQKKYFVQALQKQGHCVAMIGDGVNDVPALKTSDCSIAMTGGSSAAEKTARIVLLENRFSALPDVVMEGRRVINNISRTASLFLVKTLFSALLSFLLLFLPVGYPFQPIQMTLISTLFVGIPSFFLALEPNQKKVEGSFLKKVFSYAFPGALTIVVLILSIFALSA